MKTRVLSGESFQLKEYSLVHIFNTTHYLVIFIYFYFIGVLSVSTSCEGVGS